MNILIISSYLPFPLYSGGQVRLYNLIKELSIEHKITLICEKRENQSDADIKEMENICSKVIAVKRRKQWTIQNILKTSISPHSFLFNGHLNSQMQLLIKKELTGNKFDLIHVETYYVYQNLPPTKIPVILVEHNIEYEVYSRFAERAPFLLKTFLNIDINKIKNEELYSWKKASKLVAVSERDQKVMEQAGFKASLVSNGVNPEKFSYKDIDSTFTQKTKKILFLGDFKWMQNRDSATFIIKEIWPLIKQKKHSDLKLWIVGRNIPENIKKLSDDPSIIFDEKSSNLSTEEIFNKAYMLLAPIRVGGGTSYKIIESMSTGTPVVITLLSASSMNLKDGIDAQVGKTAKEISSKAIELLDDQKKYSSISKNAREIIEKKYTWKAISKELDRVYKSV